MRRLAFGTLILCVAVVAGCGGGGGGGPAAVPTGATMRQLQPGDQVVYAVTGTTRAGVSGTVTETVQTDAAGVPKYGGRCMKVVMVYNLTFDGTPWLYSGTVYAEQAADGTVYEFGSINSDGDYRTLSTVGAPVMYPGTLSTGESASYVAHLADGTTDNTSWAVIGLESVGGRMAYRVHTVTTNGADVSEETEWLVPDWGCPVRMQMSFQASGVRVDLVATLQSKNF